MKERFSQLRRVLVVVLIAALATTSLFPIALAEGNILDSFSSLISGFFGDDSTKDEAEEPADFYEAMDSYEAFIDEYVEFMKNLDEDELGDLTVLADYTSMLAQYSETMEKLDDIDEDELTDDEMAYYIDVMARIDKKLLELI